MRRDMSRAQPAAQEIDDAEKPNIRRNRPDKSAGPERPGAESSARTNNNQQGHVRSCDLIVFFPQEGANCTEAKRSCEPKQPERPLSPNPKFLAADRPEVALGSAERYLLADRK